MRSFSSVVCALTLFGGVLASSASGASQKVPGGHGLFGKVTSKGTGTFVLLVGATSVHVVVSSTTKYVEPGVASPSFSSLAVGLTVGVRGAADTATSSSYDASKVFISPVVHTSASSVEAHKASGSISLHGIASAVSTTSFTLTSGSTSATILLGSSTLVFENGVASPSIADLTNGRAVGVTGTAAASSTSSKPVVSASAVYLGDRDEISPPTTIPPTSTSTTTPGTSTTPRATADGELEPGGTLSAITAASFTYTKGSRTVKVLIKPYTVFYLDGSVTGASALSTSGVTVGVAGAVDASSTASQPVVDAIHVYLSHPAPASTTTTTRVTTTTVASSSPPRGTVDGELAPGGSVSAVSTSSFVYTRGTLSVLVMIKPYTLFFLDGAPASASALSRAGVTVGTSGIADPSSTSGARVIDAIHVYLSSPAPTTTAPVPTTAVSAPTSTTSAPTSTAPTTTLAGSTPRGSADGELEPGGSVSAITPTSFVYTKGSVTVTVMIKPYTVFYLNSAVTTAASLAIPGVTVGTSGIADPSSTSSARVIDAIHVYLSH